MIAYHFPPAPEIGGLRPFRFRKYLQRMGYRCHVITASPQAQDCPADTILVADELRAVWDEGPSGRLSFEAWQELLIRKAMFAGHNGFIWSRKVAARCKELVREHPRERFVVYSTYPPMGALPAGLIVHLREKIPWIVDFRDPISGTAMELLSLRGRFWNRLLEGFCFRNADAVVANVEAAAIVWRKRYPWAQRKLHVIYNGFDPEDAPQPRKIPHREYKLIVHAGALYHGRNPNVIIESLARLRASRTPEAGSVRVLLVGSIDAKAGFNQALYDEAKRDGWLEQRPSVPRSEAQRLMEEADGLLLVQPQSDTQVPGKLFEYICIGRPILAQVLRLSGVEQILQEASTPHVCIYGDESRDVVDGKLLEFLRMPNTATAPSDWFQSNFDVRQQTAALAKIIEGIG